MPEFELTYTDNSKQYVELLNDTLEQRLALAGDMLADAIRSKIGSRAVSSPGEPPGSRSGRLIASVQPNVNKLSLTVGVETDYAKYLEAGTSKMDARPFIGVTLTDKSDAVNQIVVGDPIE
jgi:HK97 gp10 family phage protein